MHLFIDESGNLGFGEKDTKYFVLACVSCLDVRPIELVLKREKMNFPNYSKISELKFNNSEDWLRKAILSKLNCKDISITAAVVEKSTIYEHLRDVKNIYYTYVSKLVINRVAGLDNVTKIELVVDKSLSKKDRGNYNEYVKYNIESKFNNLQININHLDSKELKGLQAADFVAGALLQKYERHNDSYFNLIKKKFYKDGLLIFEK